MFRLWSVQRKSLLFLFDNKAHHLRNFILTKENHFSGINYKKFSTSSGNHQQSLNPPSLPNSLSAEGLSRKHLSLAFYQFKKLTEREVDRLRKRLLRDLEKFEVVGRIYIAKEGINAQFSCPEDRLSEVKNYFNNAEPSTSLANPLPFDSTIEFNFSTAHQQAFDKLQVKIRHQVVTTNVPEEEYDISNQPTYLSAEEWHNRLTELKSSGKDPLLFDVRNQYEHVIGHFDGATLPDVDTFKEGMSQLIEDTKGHEKEEIFMYCTGGIRCSKAGAILKSKGFKDVKMLKGGITAYGNFIKSSKDKASLFKGQNFTFDKKKGEPITDEIISNCFQCNGPTAHYTNCRNVLCNVLFLQCSSCTARFKGTCGAQHCMETPILSKEENIERKPTFNRHASRVRPKRPDSVTLALSD